ncbi:MAG: hypothetical protein IT208_10205 [Chthonomonadales bacterium]|nr:hypothetical protein [Chthonomonadales bacterium]
MIRKKMSIALLGGVLLALTVGASAQVGPTWTRLPTPPIVPLGAPYYSGMVYLGPNGAMLPYPGPYGYPVYGVPPGYLESIYNPQVLPRTSDEIRVRRQADGKLFMAWQGEPALVDHITFALLDEDRQVITSRNITRLPAEAALTLSNKAEFYAVVVYYLNGTSNTVVAPI